MDSVNYAVVDIVGGPIADDDPRPLVEMGTPIRGYLNALRNSGCNHSLILFVWGQAREYNLYDDLLTLLDCIGIGLDKDRPATLEEMKQWYSDYGVTRDNDLLYFWRKLGRPGCDL
jgi:hypothetical protein